MPKRNIIHNKSNSVARAALKTALGRSCGIYLLSEYPKSGGSWIAEMISAAIEIPFPRNRLPIIGRQILHGHYLGKGDSKNTFVVIRDGRDIMVSYYYHCLFENEHFNGRLVERTKSRLKFTDINDIEKNLPRFMEFLFEDTMFPKFTWSEFVNSWINVDAYFIRYEDMLDDAVVNLDSAIRHVTGKEVPKELLIKIVEEFSFAKMANRVSGDENKSSFMRKGISGDWKEKFSSESRIVFDHYAGEELLKLKYESDKSWVVSVA